jgi:O-antigen/teichoic acid export membrane protein
MSLAKRLARGSSAAFLVHAGGVGLTYCAQVVTARMIGTAGYGIYAYVLAWVTALTYIAALGFDISLLRFVPAYLATRAFALLGGLVQYSSRRAAAAGCALAAAGVALVLSRSRQMPVNLVDTFIIGLAIVPIQAVLRVRIAIVRGFGGVVSALAPERVVRETILLISMVGIGSLWSVGSTAAMAATLLGAAIGLCAVTTAAHRLKPDAVRVAAPAYDAQAWRRTAVPLVVVGLTDALMNRTGVMLLGWFVNTSQAGIYAVAFNIAFAALLPRAAVNTLLAPVFSDLFVRNDRAGLQAIVTKASLWTFCGVASIALPIFILAEPALALFGADFVSGVPALRILLVGQVLVGAAGSQLQLLNMTGHERSSAILLVSSAIANAVIAAALVGYLGTIGAAIAATTAIVGWNVAMAVLIWRRLRVLPGFWVRWPQKGPRQMPRLHGVLGKPDISG